eukprot:gb/GECH01009791.1/.p1 GENE.gb/GECH01009791.1/~~gb/GECH01009791.1/.p1  ORF type:complete len:489 (+),score=116.15 gb/GECH01009791.1/:1-1467(+)
MQFFRAAHIHLQHQPGLHPAAALPNYSAPATRRSPSRSPFLPTMANSNTINNSNNNTTINKNSDDNIKNENDENNDHFINNDSHYNNNNNNSDFIIHPSENNMNDRLSESEISPIDTPSDESTDHEYRDEEIIENYENNYNYKKSILLNDNQNNLNNKNSNEYNEYNNNNIEIESNEKSDLNHLNLNEESQKETEQQTNDITPLTLFQVMKRCIIMCPLWFAANVLYNFSLSKTSVSSNTILSNTSSLFTFILAVFFLRSEKFSVIRFFSVFFTISGVVLVSFSDHSDGNDQLIGDILALSSAFMYAVYTVVLKKQIPHERQLSMPMFFGILGCFNFLLLLPLFPILHLTGVESFTWPSGRVWLFLTVNGLIGTVLSDMLWAWSVVLSSPLIATLGLSLTIPLALAADLVFHRQESQAVLRQPQYIVGTLMVLSAFTAANISYFLPVRWLNYDQLIPLRSWFLRRFRSDSFPENDHEDYEQIKSFNSI